MVKRKPGTLTPLEIAILGRLDAGPTYASALARAHSSPQNSVQQALVRLQLMGHTRSRYRATPGVSGGARRMFTLTPKGQAGAPGRQGPRVGYPPAQ